MDEATFALARRYADEIDHAAAAEARARRLVQDVRREHGTDSALYERVEALAAAMSSRNAVVVIGRSLQTVLTQMTATRKDRPKSRSGPADAGAAALGNLRLHQGGKA